MTVEQTVPSIPGWSGAASTDLFKPTMMGSIQLLHRIAMAPLTRLRADPVTRVPGNDAAEYYTQRASSGGLIIAEANVVSEQGAGYKGAPGIFSREQIDAWKRINESVHAKGGIHFCQVFFIGRGASPDNVKRVVAMSNIPIDKESKTELHVLTEKEIEGIVEEFRHAAECVREAGFDGIELHSANGYLIDQALQSVSNQRTDQYGGSLENRLRFPFKVMQALTSVFPSNRVGIRISPFSTFQAMREPDPYPTSIAWLRKLLTQWPDLAYVHCIESRIDGSEEQESDSDRAEDSVQPFRDVVQELGGGKVKFLTAGGYDPKSAAEHSQKYPEDLIVFGRYFIANPDLPERIKKGNPLRRWDRGTFYTPGSKGYTDQPTYEEELQAQNA